MHSPDRSSFSYTELRQVQVSICLSLHLDRLISGGPAGAWAPTLSYINGKYYLAAMTRWTYDPVARVWPRVMLVSSRDLRTWSDPIWGDPWGIDPSLFQDPVSQKVYLNLMAPNNNKDRIWGIYQCEVDIDSGRCIREYRSMWNGTLPHNASARPEGPKMFKRDKWYYLLIAEGKYLPISEAADD